jgi:hypothetical protein
MKHFSVKTSDKYRPEKRKYKLPDGFLKKSLEIIKMRMYFISNVKGEINHVFFKNLSFGSSFCSFLCLWLFFDRVGESPSKSGK